MDLVVTLIQSELHWECEGKNLEMFTSKINSLPSHSDIIILPEMFNTGFSMNSENLAQQMDGECVGWMKLQAQKLGSVIIGSLIIGEENNYFNRLVWAQPDGEIFHYDKRHLFRMAGEDQKFSSGSRRLIVTYKGWRFCPLVCYDLRFPVWSRNKKLANNIDLNFGSVKGDRSVQGTAFDCLIYIANWPAARKSPWIKLLEARALENQCYVIGVNRVGEDDNGITYSGNTMVINPRGERMAELEDNIDDTITMSLSLSELDNFRESFPVAKDSDDFNILL